MLDLCPQLPATNPDTFHTKLIIISNNMLPLTRLIDIEKIKEVRVEAAVKEAGVISNNLLTAMQKIPSLGLESIRKDILTKEHSPILFATSKDQDHMDL